MEITKTVELKNVVLLVTKKNEAQLIQCAKSICRVCKMMFKQIAPVLFKCFLKPLQKHFDNLFVINFAD